MKFSRCKTTMHRTFISLNMFFWNSFCLYYLLSQLFLIVLVLKFELWIPPRDAIIRQAKSRKRTTKTVGYSTVVFNKSGSSFHVIKSSKQCIQYICIEFFPINPKRLLIQFDAQIILDNIITKILPVIAAIKQIHTGEYSPLSICILAPK